MARVVHPIQGFIHNFSVGKMLLIIAIILALLVVSSLLANEYDAVIHTYFTVSLVSFDIRENVLHWLNDGLIAIVFFVIGFKIKRGMS